MMHPGARPGIPHRASAAAIAALSLAALAACGDPPGDAAGCAEQPGLAAAYTLEATLTADSARRIRWDIYLGD
jgi:hypothetical protein